jgi:hypothetical protein
MAVCLQRTTATAPFVLAEVPFQIARDKQVQIAIAIEVNKTRAGGPAATRYACLRRDVFKHRAALVAIQSVATQSTYKQICAPVVIAVANRHALPIASPAQPGLFRDIRESSVALVPMGSRFRSQRRSSRRDPSPSSRSSTPRRLQRKIDLPSPSASIIATPPPIASIKYLAGVCHTDMKSIFDAAVASSGGPVPRTTRQQRQKISHTICQ